MAEPIDLNTATAAQLKAWKRTLAPEELEANPTVLEELNDLILEKSVEERMIKMEGTLEEKARIKELEGLAYTRWPELKDEKSEFRKQADEIAEQRGISLLDAANDVGYQTYGQGGTKTPPDNVAPGNSENAPADKTPRLTEFLERTSNIREAFAEEGRPFSEESLERISTSAEEANGEES